jgi:hypothetical protein
MRFVRSSRRLSAGKRPTRPAPGGEPDEELNGCFRLLLDDLCAGVLRGRRIADGFGLVAVLRELIELWEEGEDAPPGPVARYLVEQHGWASEDAQEVAHLWFIVFLLRHLLAIRER